MEERMMAKNGYSIWSLLMIMTLLAVWLAIPRTLSRGIWSVVVIELFIAAHQITLWLMISGLIWIASGKRRTIAYLLIGVVVLVWAPLVIVNLERGCLHTDYVLALMNWLGLTQVIGGFYDLVARGFGYEEQATARD